MFIQLTKPISQEDKKKAYLYKKRQLLLAQQRRMFIQCENLRRQQLQQQLRQRKKQLEKEHAAAYKIQSLWRIRQEKNLNLNSEQIKIYSYKEKDPKITFIIPSIGRDTLKRTIDSIIALNNPNWKVIIIMDGVPCPYNIEDKYKSKIMVMNIPKTGRQRSGGQAGKVRNIGILRCDTEWVAFVDDDDTISPDYIDKALEEIKKDPKVDCIVFRMFREKVIPALDAMILRDGDVGISFLVKTDIAIENPFINNNFEDYFFLKNLYDKKYNINLSKHLTYFVRNARIKNINYWKATEVKNIQIKRTFNIL